MAIMQGSDNSQELNKLYRCAAADKEFLRLLIQQEKKEQKLLDVLIDHYNDDHYRKNCRQRFLRSYTLTAEKKGVDQKENKVESVEVYKSVNRAKRCYKLCYVVNTALLRSCIYMAQQYRYLTRIVKRKV